MQGDSKRVLLTGATGFVGGALEPALVAAGWQVRCLTRDVSAARRRWPKLQWFQGEVNDGNAVVSALEGCSAAFYLVHGMDEGDDFETRDRAGAMGFAKAAAAAGIERIVYLGGLAPTAAAGGPTPEISPHLRSRLQSVKSCAPGAFPRSNCARA